MKMGLPHLPFVSGQPDGSSGFYENVVSALVLLP